MRAAITISLPLFQKNGRVNGNENSTAKNLKFSNAFSIIASQAANVALPVAQTMLYSDNKCDFSYLSHYQSRKTPLRATTGATTLPLESLHTALSPEPGLACIAGRLLVSHASFLADSTKSRLPKTQQNKRPLRVASKRSGLLIVRLNVSLLYLLHQQLKLHRSMLREQYCRMLYQP